MDEDTKTRFWKDMIVPTQEEYEDVAFANPVDVANALVKSRNWASTISSELARLTGRRASVVKRLRRANSQLASVESLVFANVDKVPTTALRTKESRRGFIIKNLDQAGLGLLTECEASVRTEEDILDDIDAQIEELEILRRVLERSTDWLIQYINWHKFELREM